MVPVPEDKKMMNPWNRSLYMVRAERRVAVHENICNDESSPCPGLVLLYARLGLHSYNLLQGKNIGLSSVKKYNKSGGGCAASSYGITLEAMDHALQTFVTKVYEEAYGSCVLLCRIAKPKGETIDASKRSSLGETIDASKRSSLGETIDASKRSSLWETIDASKRSSLAETIDASKRSSLAETIDASKRSSLGDSYFLIDTVPEWPPENPFENSSKRYYVLNKSELQDNMDWVRLYLELVVATSNRRTIETHDLSNLKIVKVAIDTTPQGVDVEFNRKIVAIVYIRYKDSCEARVGKDVDRVAIVRRAFTEELGYFSFVGQTLSSEIIPKKEKVASTRSVASSATVAVVFFSLILGGGWIVIADGRSGGAAKNGRLLLLLAVPVTVMAGVSVAFTVVYCRKP